MSYKFFQNKECEWFPCHSTHTENFNCLFCFCPLHHILECGGNYKIIQNGIKDCSGCVIPHKNYDYIISKLKEFAYEN
ncbi:MAG: metal-binding protein [Ruminococcaceae bacterium]|nr:metal-binding protein [Oscillospiraceae bacterium]